MTSLTIGLASCACIYGGALLGSWLQRRLPGAHLDKNSHEIIKLAAGMVATMSALVLGLMVSAAKNTYDTISTGVVTDSTKIILFDRALAHYGPAAAPIREELRRIVSAALAQLQSRGADHESLLQYFEKARGLEQVEEQLRTLVPANDAQRQLLAECNKLLGEMVQTRWFVIETAQNQIPRLYLVLLVCWLTVLFTSFGLFAPRNPTVFVMLFVCAFTVSSAIYLVLELSQPLTGIIRMPHSPLEAALRHLGQD